MIVDAVLANDEWDLVVFRLKYLSPVVQRLYIGESNKTFSALDKELFFTKRLPELTSMGFDVCVLAIDIPDDLARSQERWAIETHARNSFLEAVSREHPDDVVFFSDVDEVPSLDQVRRVIAERKELGIVSIPTQVFLRRANWLEYEPHQWRGKWGNALKGQHWVPRIRRGHYPLVAGEPGAHFSYVGMGASDIRKKYQAFSHGELDRDDVASEDFLGFADYFHISHLGRALEPGAGLLRVVQPQDFTDIQQRAYEWYPEWFSLETIAQPRHRRLVASWLLFGSIRGSLRGDLLDAFEPVWSWRWLRHAVTYSATWVGWNVALRLGVLRFLRRSPKEAP
jgi:beta-1,4-mannosyl-glycoprotein beta-1,4-N-acetylglucosaminyltransferase